MQFPTPRNLAEAKAQFEEIKKWTAHQIVVVNGGDRAKALSFCDELKSLIWQNVVPVPPESPGVEPEEKE